MTKCFDTERLRLRPFTPTDTEALHRLFVVPEVRRYLLDNQCVDREWVEGVIADSEALFEASGFGLWNVSLLIPSPRASQVLGFAGFREFFDPPQLQLLYGLHPELWGQGYATEIARALIDRAFRDFGLDEVIAATDRPNLASVRVMKRAGLLPWKTTDEGLGGTVYYRLQRPKAQS